MATYLFKTTIAIKPLQSEEWWDNPNIIEEMTIDAKNLNEALDFFCQRLNSKYYIAVSKYALRNKYPMFHEDDFGNSKQTGYVIKGKVEFCTDDGIRSSHYIELWTKIIEVREIDFSKE